MPTCVSAASGNVPRWWLHEKLKWICRAGFHTSLFHSCHAGGGWSHIVHCSTPTYEVMSGPLTCHCCFPHSLLPVLTAPPSIPLGAEVIQKECLALVQQTVEGERETEERKESNIEIKVVFLRCWEGLSVLLVPGNYEVLLRTDSVLLQAFSGARQRKLKNTCGCMFSKLSGLTVVIF